VGGDLQLQANLAALATTSPELVERLGWPAAGDRAVTGPDGQLHYRTGLGSAPLALTPGQVDGALSGVGDGPVLLAGLGLGELATALLAGGRTAPVVAWEPDPSLLRRALAQHALRLPLASGRLRLLLGSDLLEAARAGELEGLATVLHPLLGPLHHRDLAAAAAPARPLALVAAGGLFVDDLASALEATGLATFTLDLVRLSRQELARAVARLRPQLLACVNYTEGLAEFCAEHGVRLLVWEIDPAVGPLRPCQAPTDRTFIFTFRQAAVAEYRAAGFQHAAWLPLAANPERRQPTALEGEEGGRYRSRVALVGSSLVPQVTGFERSFLAAWQAFAGPTAEVARSGAALLQAVLAEQARSEHYLVPEALQRLAPEFARVAGQVPVRAVGEIAAAMRRLAVALRLAPFEVQLWGDEGWRQAQAPGVTYRGLAGHGAELNRIYSGAAVNVDVGRLYQSDIVTMRVFDVMACGGLVLAERSEDLARLFAVGEEVDCWSNGRELSAKVAHWLEHPAQAAELARRGREAVLARHTIRQRVEEMLRTAGCRPGG
jgi:spore maturation protein CgeB